MLFSVKVNQILRINQRFIKLTSLVSALTAGKIQISQILVVLRDFLSNQQSVFKKRKRHNRVIGFGCSLSLLYIAFKVLAGKSAGLIMGHATIANLKP